MGLELLGKCQCGYERNVHISSTRALRGKVFRYPHHCSSCKSLTSVDVLESNYQCDLCFSSAVFNYSATSKKLPSNSTLQRLPSFLLALFNYHKQEQMAEENYCTASNKTFTLLKGGHYCPACSFNNLQFSPISTYD